ncbi:unnamed protein product [Paramecium pentaurelia]|uniref:Uncharacterized protein n=1 Tax=Paramecium pentaurelia TaxID=43138 RepID=A0A8S1VEU9_9CILI|nr:unnamed protein product [Paramecium pentaurelia]
MKSRYQGTMNWDSGHQKNMMPTPTLVQSRNAGFGSSRLLLERPQVAQDLCFLLELIKEHTLQEYMEFQKQFASMNRTKRIRQEFYIISYPSIINRRYQIQSKKKIKYQIYNAISMWQVGGFLRHQNVNTNHKLELIQYINIKYPKNIIYLKMIVHKHKQVSHQLHEVLTKMYRQISQVQKVHLFFFPQLFQKGEYYYFLGQKQNLIKLFAQVFEYNIKDLALQQKRKEQQLFTISINQTIKLQQQDIFQSHDIQLKKQLLIFYIKDELELNF